MSGLMMERNVLEEIKNQCGFCGNELEGKDGDMKDLLKAVSHEIVPLEKKLKKLYKVRDLLLTDEGQKDKPKKKTVRHAPGLLESNVLLVSKQAGQKGLTATEAANLIEKTSDYKFNNGANQKSAVRSSMNRLVGKGKLWRGKVAEKDRGVVYYLTEAHQKISLTENLTEKDRVNLTPAAPVAERHFGKEGEEPETTL